IKPQAKYPGFILDRKLNWKPNIEERWKKALVGWYTCHEFLGNKFELIPNITRWMYLVAFDLSSHVNWMAYADIFLNSVNWFNYRINGAFW
uniref:Uncharacterized protein n=1 Tax=Megaselia scalaris TaxID=36166 RepID=T1GSC4_MEGSC